MEAFVYCWTDIAREKLYVGYHKGTPDDGYVCSSKTMLFEYNQRPKDFVRQIIATGTHKDMVAFETTLLKNIDAKNDDGFYNKNNGQKDFYTSSHTEETKRKISKAKTGRKREDVRINNLTNNPVWDPEIAKKCGRDVSGEFNPMFGKSHNDITKATISKNRKGKGKQPKSPETKARMAEARKLWWAKKRGEV